MWARVGQVQESTSAFPSDTALPLQEVSGQVMPVRGQWLMARSISSVGP